MTIEIRPITAAETHLVRQLVLRPQETPEAQVYPRDDAPESLHVGAYLDGKLIGVATIFHEPSPGTVEPEAWRLRGMATLPEARRQGVGAGLVCACVAHIAGRGGTSLWCNGRTSALAFYSALGFRPEGDEFVTSSGPHFVLRRPVTAQDRQ